MPGRIRLATARGPAKSISRWPLAAGLLWVAPLGALPAVAQEEPPPALVVTAPVTSESITEEVEFLGTARPLLDSLVASEIEGRVAERLVENGEYVEKGQVLVRLDGTKLRADLASTMAGRAETEARLALARRQEERAQSLHDSDVLSAGLYEERVAERKALEGRLAGIDARIQSIRYDLERTEIRAPFGGVVTELHCEIGEWIARGAPAARLADLGTLEIRLDVPERYFPHLAPRTPAPATFDALPEVKLDSKIFAVVPQADESARTFPVLVRARNPKGKVGAGMLARVRLSVSAGRAALLVPKDAIVRQAQQSVVYVVGDDATVRAVGVRTRTADGTRVEITGDVKAGDTIVVKGNERLVPGQKVRTEDDEGLSEKR